jgi:hypothetical protein
MGDRFRFDDREGLQCPGNSSLCKLPVTRRAVVKAIAGTALALGSTGATSAEWSAPLEWLWKTVTEAVPTLDECYRVLLKLRRGYKILLNDRERLRDVRRKLTDSSPEKEIQTKLEDWLGHYQSYKKEKSRSGERDAVI